MAKKKEPEMGQILPARDTVVISRDADGEVMIKVSRNMSYREAAWLLDAAMAQLPIDDDEVIVDD